METDRIVSATLLFFGGIAWNQSHLAKLPEFLTPAQQKDYTAVADHYNQLLGGLLESATYGMPTAPPPPSIKRCFRVREVLSDIDHDGVPDFIESAFGTSIWLPDTDGDGMSDAVEIAADTDGNDTDTDNDGIPDNVDPEPLEPATPGVLGIEQRDLDYQFTVSQAATTASGEQSGSGTLHYWRGWKPYADDAVSISTSVPPELLPGKLEAKFPYDAAPPVPFSDISWDSPLFPQMVEGYYLPSSPSGPATTTGNSTVSTYPEDPAARESAQVRGKAIWLVRTPKSTGSSTNPPYEESQFFLKVLETSQFAGGIYNPEQAEVVKLTIPADWWNSEKVELRTPFKANGNPRARQYVRDGLYPSLLRTSICALSWLVRCS